MKSFTTLALLSTALVVIGCNEKVAPELQNAASSSTVPEVIPPSEYYFGISNVSSYLLNYKLHKTGVGNLSAACETRKTTPLSSVIYSAGDPGSDVTCYLEAEELALWYGGMDLQVSASSNTCEYVGYSPFSYYNRPAGDSSGNLFKVTCSSDQVDDALIADGMTQIGVGLSANFVTANPSGFPTCLSGYVDPRLSNATRYPFSVTSDEELCRYNYTDGDQEKCDEGTISITEMKVDKDSTTGNAKVSWASKTIKCGGKNYNCIKGPIRLLDTKSSRFTKIYDTARNAAFSKSFSFPSLYTANASSTSNMEYVNYRRNLASLGVDYVTAVNTTAPYMAAFSAVTDYTPNLMDRYSNNKRMDGTALLDTAAITAGSTFSDSGSHPIQYARAATAEAFLGIGNARTNPFYTFYCLDAALDIKSRIRLLVRDWDRTFPSNSNLELISDINLGTAARQDVPITQEIPDDQDGLNWFNDRGDWDDDIPMTRTAGNYDPTTTVWAPASGFFKSANYPLFFAD